MGYGRRCRTRPLRSSIRFGFRIPVARRSFTTDWADNYGCEFVKWGNESWTQRPYGFDVGTTPASSGALPRCSLAGSERLTTACTGSGWPLQLPRGRGGE